MASDEMLAAQAATGDGVAFDTLVLRYQSRIYRMLRLRVDGESDAEDLTQETFIRAYCAIVQFRGDSAFRTWLHRIALNVLWSHRARRRQRARLWAVEPHSEADAPPETATCGDDPEAALIKRDAIDRALSTLSAEARVVVILRDIQGLGYQEIATITGVPNRHCRIASLPRAAPSASTPRAAPRLRKVGGMKGGAAHTSGNVRVTRRPG